MQCWLVSVIIFPQKNRKVGRTELVVVEEERKKSFLALYANGKVIKLLLGAENRSNAHDRRQLGMRWPIKVLRIAGFWDFIFALRDVCRSAEITSLGGSLPRFLES